MRRPQTFLPNIPPEAIKAALRNVAAPTPTTAPGPTMTQLARELLAELDRKAPAPVQTQTERVRVLLSRWGAKSTK